MCRPFHWQPDMLKSGFANDRGIVVFKSNTPVTFVGGIEHIAKIDADAKLVCGFLSRGRFREFVSKKMLRQKLQQ
jgi:hypothetical protein